MWDFTISLHEGTVWSEYSDHSDVTSQTIMSDLEKDLRKMMLPNTALSLRVGHALSVTPTDTATQLAA